MNRSLNGRIVTRLQNVGSYTTTQTPSTGVDMKGLATAEIVVAIGAMTNTGGSPHQSWAFALQHSDTSNANFEAVVAADVVLDAGNNAGTLGAGGTFATVDAAAEDDAVYRVGYIGNKRYVRVVQTAANTPGATSIAVMVVGEPLLAPGVDTPDL